MMNNDNGAVHLPPKSPTQTNVTVMTDTGPNPQSLEIRLNIGYFKTAPGIVKILQLILGVVCMACAAPAVNIALNRAEFPFGVGHNHWFLFVVVTCFIVTILWTFFYLLGVRDYIKVKLPFTFLKVEVIYTAVATFLYFISFIVILAGFSWCSSSQAYNGSHFCDARVAGGVFAVFNTVAYGYGAYLTYNEYNSTPPELQ